MSRAAGRITFLMMLLVGIVAGGVLDDDDYYAGEYDEQGELTTGPPPTTILQDETFRVTCDAKSLTLTVRKADLPGDLVLNVPQASSAGNVCVELTESSSISTYRVALSCHEVVKESRVGARVFLQHEALLVRNGAVVTRTNPYYALYTMVLECQQANAGNNVMPRAEIQVNEHRVTSGSSENCKRQLCPYGALCLPAHLVNGYYCICSDQNNCEMSCPTDFYGCQRENSSELILPRLQCINNGWLCDKRFDCKLKDDETKCAEIWSEWGQWSKCSASCGEGVQVRKRKCDLSFTPDPDRCKIHRHALGCSRRCENNNQTEVERQVCKEQSCSIVTCDRHRMTVVIPREQSMTSRAIASRMMIGGDPTCAPSHNATHVIFVTLLNRCNTTSQIDDQTVTYRNEIVFKPSTDPRMVIMRDIGHSYAVNCRFNRRRTVILRKKKTAGNNASEVAALDFKHKGGGLNSNNNKENWPEGESLVEHYASGNGEFEFKMDLYEDSTFSRAYAREAYPLTKKLHEEVFIGVRFNTDDVDLKLVVEKCQATPNIQAKSDVVYVFIENGCAIDETVQFYDKRNNMATFSIQAFKFSDATLPYVYFRCDVVVCDVGDEDPVCQRNCSDSSSARHKRSVGGFPVSVDDERIRGHVVQGPIVIEEEFGEVMESDVRSEESAVIHRRIVNMNGRFIDEEQATVSSGGIPHLLFALIGAAVCVAVGALAGVMLSLKIRRRNPPTQV